ncbi:MAG: hypothetical protein ACFHW5_01480 [Verrucomicrobiota bacterium]
MPNKFLHFQSRFLMGCFCLLSVLKLFLPAVAQGSPKQVSAERIQHGFLVCGNMTALFDENSQVVWQVDGGSRDGYVLGNGNLLISNGRVAREYTRSNEVVWSYQLNAVNKELGTAVRLDSGNTMLVERGIKPRLLEINAQGEIKAEIPLQPDTDNAHMQTRMARKLANGNYIAPHLLGFAIKEYAPDGTVLKTIRTDLAELGGREEENWPFTAIRLANGNTLANLTHGNKTVEFDISGKVVWRVDNTDVEGRFSDPCGGQRLPNGNTVIASYAQRDASKPRLFEITPDKKVVWEFFHPSAHAHGIHVISTNGKKLSDASLK